jgi:hypothetical protein
MRGLNRRAIVTRVKGPGALTKSLVRILLRANRFASHRARTRDDQVWAGRFIDALRETLRVARESSPECPPCPPYRGAAELGTSPVTGSKGATFELVGESVGDVGRGQRPIGAVRRRIGG